MIDYIVMLSQFNNKCNETKKPILMNTECFYVPSERRAYLRESQKACWLIINGNQKNKTPVKTPEPVKSLASLPLPSVVKTPEVLEDHPAALPSRRRQAPRSECLVEKHADGSTSVLTVYYPR